VDIILIAAITQDGFIARHKNERINWSKDLWLFKKQTMGYPVFLGSRTWSCIKKDLKGREVIVVHRDDKPKEMLSKLNSEKCFIAGGGLTNTKFKSHLTHLFVTPHPLLFGSGIRLFSESIKEPALLLQKTVPVNIESRIYQYQYQITKKLR